MTAVLVTNAEMSGLANRVVLDVTWRKVTPDGRERYLAGHIPGAHFADLDHDFTGVSDGKGERSPLPSPEILTARLRRWGVFRSSTVVVTDSGKGRASARAWWILRHAGVTDVRILDGGTDAWVAAGNAVKTDDPPMSQGNARATYGAMPTIDAQGAAVLAAQGQLLDARDAARYQGFDEGLDPRMGHIPGAVLAPTGWNLERDGRFRPSADLLRRFVDLGVKPGHHVGVYCGSGIAAAHEIAALAIAGIDASLYTGSWSDWSRHPELPVALGPQPG